MSRTKGIDPQQLYDLIVVGGGITGAGVARDAALRGLSVLLLEKRDFASGVSSKTTRLIHGGLRYLATFEVDLVAESLRERAILRRQAPYLIRPIPILIPIYRGDPHGRAVMSLGIHLYDLLSHEKDVPHYFTSDRERTLSFEPRLERDGLVGSALFYDHQILMPERLVIENVIAAREAGATALNHHRVELIMETPDGVVVTVRDVLGNRMLSARGRVLINAGGPWIDKVRKAGGIDGTAIIHPTKGIHLVLPKLSDQALFVSSADGRMFFILPLGGHSLIGTTDTNYDGDLDEVHANAADVDYLLRESRRVLPGLALNRGSILYTYAGIRPLAFAGPRESRISRKHRVIREGRNGRIITIAGGKLTTYRNMARDVVDAACRALGNREHCMTDRKPLPGDLAGEHAKYLEEMVPEFAAEYNTDAETVRHLVGIYGSRTERVLEIAREEPSLGKRIAPESNDILAQVAYAAAEEAGRTISDIVLRRMPLGITAGRGAEFAERIAEIAGNELGWNEDERTARVRDFHEDLKKEKSY